MTGTPPGDKKLFTLSDEDIASGQSVSRRRMLGTLGVGAAAIVGTAVPASAQRRSDPAGRGRRCRFRDSDTTPDGRPFDTARVHCGLSDGD
jgi:hypothetical protein